MEVELVPDPGADDPAAEAALHALRREGLPADAGPDGVSLAWQRAGRAEAMRDGCAPERPQVRALVSAPRASADRD